MIEDSSEEASPPTPNEGAACEYGTARCDSRRASVLELIWHRIAALD
jgi:hypothetical protein